MADTQNQTPEGLDDFLGDENPTATLAANTIKHYATKALDDGPTTSDSIEPTTSPIDYIAGGVGAKLGSTIGKAVARDAGAIVGNNIGAVGRDILAKKPFQSAAMQALPQEPEGLMRDAMARYPHATDFNSLYKAADSELAPGHPIMQVLQQHKNRQFAEGGDVSSSGGAPEGLDSFLSEQQAPAVQVNGANVTPPNPEVTAEMGHALSGDPAPEGFNDLAGEQINEDKYGTMTQQAIAGAEGFAKGLVGPLAPATELAMGLTTPEAIRAREDVNPITHGIAEATGFLAPMAATMGASAPAQVAARFTQLGAMETVGRALAGAGLKAGETLASKVGAGVATAAIENMLLSGGDEISKMITQDPNQSAQTAAAHVGLAGILGGGLGGAAGGVGHLWQATVGDKAGKEIANFVGRIKEHMESPEPASAVTSELQAYHDAVSGTTDAVYGAKGLKSQDIAKLMPELHDKMIDQVANTGEVLNKAVSKLEKDPHANLLNSAIDKYKAEISTGDPAKIFEGTQALKQQLQEWGKFNKDMVPLAERPFRNAAKDLAQDLRVSLEDPAVWGKAGERQQAINSAATKYFPALKDFQSKFMTKVEGEFVMDPSKVSSFVKQAEKGGAEIKKTMLGNFLNASDKYVTEVNKTHGNLGLEPAVLPTSTNAIQRIMGEQSQGAKLADKFIAHGLGKVSGAGVGGALGHMTGIPGAGAIGAMVGGHSLEKFFTSALPALAKPLMEGAHSALGLKASVDYAMQVAKGEALLSRASKGIFTQGVAKATDGMTSEKDLAKLDKQVKHYSVNPMDMQHVAGDVGHYLPAHNAAIGQTGAQAIAYLSSLAPPTAKQSPLDSKPVVSAEAKAKYNNALRIAQNPTSVIDRIKSGTVTMSDMTSLRTMFPSLYSSLATKITNDMTNHLDKGKTIPYTTRQGLSMFLGTPMDSTMTPSAIMAAQSTGASAKAQGNQQAQVAPGAKKSAASLSKMANNYQTTEQTRTERASKSD
jgi:hypothetical protein